MSSPPTLALADRGPYQWPPLRGIHRGHHSNVRSLGPGVPTSAWNKHRSHAILQGRDADNQSKLKKAAKEAKMATGRARLACARDAKAARRPKSARQSLNARQRSAVCPLQYPRTRLALAESSTRRRRREEEARARARAYAAGALLADSEE